MRAQYTLPATVRMPAAKEDFDEAVMKRLLFFFFLPPEPLQPGVRPHDQLAEILCFF